MNGYLIFCRECERPVEGVLIDPRVRTYRATAQFADAHHERYGHWPSRVHIHEASATALRLVGRR